MIELANWVMLEEEEEAIMNSQVPREGIRRN